MADEKLPDINWTSGLLVGAGILLGFLISTGMLTAGVITAGEVSVVAETAEAEPWFKSSDIIAGSALFVSAIVAIANFRSSAAAEKANQIQRQIMRDQAKRDKERDKAQIERDKAQAKQYEEQAARERYRDELRSKQDEVEFWRDWACKAEGSYIDVGERWRLANERSSIILVQLLALRGDLFRNSLEGKKVIEAIRLTTGVLDQVWLDLSTYMAFREKIMRIDLIRGDMTKDFLKADLDASKKLSPFSSNKFLKFSMDLDNSEKIDLMQESISHVRSEYEEMTSFYTQVANYFAEKFAEESNSYLALVRRHKLR